MKKRSIDNGKILHVLHMMGAMNVGGAESALLSLLGRLKDAHVHSDICVFSDRVGGYESQIIGFGYKVVRCKLSKNIFSFILRFYLLLKRRHYDVVDSNMAHFSGICLLVARLAGVPKRVNHFHNTSDVGKNSMLRRIYKKIMVASILRNATNIVGVSKDVLGYWVGPDWHNNPKISLRYNGLDTTAYHCQPDPDWLRNEFSIPLCYKIVVHVGRFIPQKNHSKLVEIAATYLQQYADTCFILVGEGVLRPGIEGLVSRKGLEDRFRFAGVRRDVFRIMKNADAFLFPSVWEGFGIVVAEAIAAGLPMVVSDLPAIREIFAICGSAEMLSPQASSIEWAQALKRAIDMPRQMQWLDQLENSCLSAKEAAKTLLEIYRK